MWPRKSASNPLPAYLIQAESLRGNPGQWAAYESTGNTVILAGPGSGKTKTLTTKLARVLNEDVNWPHGVACITYSTECARELKRRLAELGILESRNIFVGTIHGFCLNHVVRPYANLADIRIPWPIRVADDVTWERAFGQALNQLGIREEPRYVKPRMERYRRNYLDRNSNEWMTKDPETAELSIKFEELLHSQGYLDFDDMVLIGLKLIVDNGWVRRALHSRFPVFFIDEYQDLGLPLHRIVLSLCYRADVRIVAVGDPDQSIYSFTGAQPQLLKGLAARPGFSPIQLSMNYRSGRRIVAGSIVSLAEPRTYESAQKHEGTIDYWECPGGIEEQTDTICKTIVPQALASRPGRQLGDIAILYLDKFDAVKITKAVRKNNFKYVGGDKNVRYRATPLTRWLEDCAAWCSGGWRKGVPQLSSLISYWLQLHQDAGTGHTENQARSTLVQFLWKHKDESQPLNIWLGEFRSAGLNEVVDLATSMSDEKGSLVELVSAASDPTKLADFDIGSFGSMRGSPTHLNLVTLHSSKGLEFDAVILMGLEQGRIPRYKSSDESLREERRKFYVGLTRARFEVHLVYSGWYEAYGRQFRNGPSQFITELQSKLSQK